VVNAFWVPWIYFFYVETAGLSLDEIDRVFEIKFTPGANMTYQEATNLAKAEASSEGHGHNSKDGEVFSEKQEAVEHVEQKV